MPALEWLTAFQLWLSALGSVWLQVTVKASVPLDVGVDETYALTVPSVCGVAATLSANTQWGALRGASFPACPCCGLFSHVPPHLSSA
jgi:hypothetical protein